jgi:hypothetical protein
MDVSTECLTKYVGTQQLARVLPDSREGCLEGLPSGSTERLLAERFIDRYWPSREATWSAYSFDGVRQAVDGKLRLTQTYAANDYPEAERQPVICLVAP